VAGFSQEFDQQLKDRWLLSQNVLLYRTGAGAMVALQNRCPHRGFPLSKGAREGDTVVCGYHGLTFDADGRCVRAPMLRSAPGHVCVQCYPVCPTSTTLSGRIDSL
jgi:phenylpropionate dioxygenase-like ring-hydroxylating dioxygenase large terminal subunit